MTYERLYRLIGFGSIGLIVLYFSVALSRSMGWVGLVLPSLLITSAYLVITFALDGLLYWLRTRSSDTRRRIR